MLGKISKIWLIEKNTMPWNSNQQTLKIPFRKTNINKIIILLQIKLSAERHLQTKSLVSAQKLVKFEKSILCFFYCRDKKIRS